MEHVTPRSQGPGRRVRPLAAAVALLVLLTLAACVPAGEIRRSEPTGTLRAPQTSLGLAGARIVRFDPPGAGSQLELLVPTDVRNPNEFPLRLTGIDYALEIEGAQVGSGRVDLDLPLAAGQSVRLRVSPVVDLERRTRLLTEVVRAFAGDPLQIALRGTLEFSSPGFSFTSRRLTIAEGEASALQAVVAPELAYDAGESAIYLLRPDAPVIRVVVRAANPGDLGYFLYGRDLTLRLGGVDVAREDLAPQPLPAGSEGRFDLLFYPPWDRLGPDARAALEAALAGAPVQIELNGQLRVDVLGIDSFDVPPGWSVGGPLRSATAPER